MKLSSVIVLAAASLISAAADDPCNDNRDCEKRCINETYHVVNKDGASSFGCIAGLATPIYEVKNCRITNAMGADPEGTEIGDDICRDINAYHCANSGCALSSDKAKLFDEACGEVEGTESLSIRSGLGPEDLETC